MTRKSRRELERAVDGLTDAGDGGRWPMIVFDTGDGGYVDADGNSLPTDGGGDLDAPTTADGGPVFVLPAEHYDDLPGGADE